MRQGIALFTIITAMATAIPSGAFAQRNYLQRPTTISVQYQLRLPVTDDPADQTRGANSFT